jgi:hypothetical protein
MALKGGVTELPERSTSEETSQEDAEAGTPTSLLGLLPQHCQPRCSSSSFCFSCLQVYRPITQYCGERAGAR